MGRSRTSKARSPRLIYVNDCDFTYVSSTDLDDGQSNSFKLLFSGATMTMWHLIAYRWTAILNKA